MIRMRTISCLVASGKPRASGDDPSVHSSLRFSIE